ncbi:MAG TPA: hypothetical protein VN578_02085 [Candidatus Binatia bacterium]|jgi:hypothetical protein|nr:hypothetical protein [Candidatus Binatia bacterium]
MNIESKLPSSIKSENQPTQIPQPPNSLAGALLLNLTRAINAPQPWHPHPRNGKVARLPASTRDLINGMLEDGLSYPAIIDKLQTAGCLPYPLSEMNLSNWYHGGYRDWLLNKSKRAGGLAILQQLAASKAAAAQSTNPTIH